MLSRIKVVVFFITIFLISCSKHIPVNDSFDSKYILEKILAENLPVCNLNKRGVFFYEDRFNKVKFKGALIKDCENNFSLSVLGAFNQPVLILKGDNDNITIIKSDVENVEDYLRFFEGNNLRKILNLLNYPLIFPDSTYSMKIAGDFFVFIKGDRNIYVNRLYRIVRIKEKGFEVQYEYDKDLKKMQVSSDDFEMKVTYFL
jgi:hypothetical protein